jgi:hypothetical protein
VTFEETVAGAWKATQLDESESAKRKSFCALRVVSPAKVIDPSSANVAKATPASFITKSPVEVRLI